MLICVCCLRQSQHLLPLLILTSEVTLVFSFQMKAAGMGSEEQSRVVVIGNDRTGRGKYQSKTCCSLGLWSCRFKAPRLLGSCQLIKTTSLPIPTGIQHQTALGAFYPKQNTASCHRAGPAMSCMQTAKFNTAE